MNARAATPDHATEYFDGVKRRYLLGEDGHQNQEDQDGDAGHARAIAREAPQGVECRRARQARQGQGRGLGQFGKRVGSVGHGLVQTNARIEIGVREIHDQVDDDKHEGDSDSESLHHRVVARQDGVDQLRTHAGQSKDGFGEHGA